MIGHYDQMIYQYSIDYFDNFAIVYFLQRDIITCNLDIFKKIIIYSDFTIRTKNNPSILLLFSYQ